MKKRTIVLSLVSIILPTTNSFTQCPLLRSSPRRTAHAPNAARRVNNKPTFSLSAAPPFRRQSFQKNPATSQKRKKRTKIKNALRKASIGLAALLSFSHRSSTSISGSPLPANAATVENVNDVTAVTMATAFTTTAVTAVTPDDDTTSASSTVETATKKVIASLAGGAVAGAALGRYLLPRNATGEDAAATTRAGKDEYERLVAPSSSSRGVDGAGGYDAGSLPLRMTDNAASSPPPPPAGAAASSELMESYLRHLKAQREKEKRYYDIAVARRQPLGVSEETALKEKYARLPLEERAFQILYDLGMVEMTPDPEEVGYDDYLDDEFCRD